MISTDDLRDKLANELTGASAYRTYVADALMPVIREALADAWDQGYDECEEPHFIDRHNPWRTPH